MLAKMFAKRQGDTAEKKKEFQTPAKGQNPLGNIVDILNKTKK